MARGRRAENSALMLHCRNTDSEEGTWGVGIGLTFCAADLIY